MVDHDSAGVGLDDGFDKPVLTAVLWEVHRLPIVALGLPLGVKPNDDDCDISLPRNIDGLLEVVYLVLFLETDAAAPVPMRHIELFLLGDRSELICHLDAELDRLSSLHIHVDQVIDRAIEHGLPFFGPIPKIESELSVDVQPPRTHAHETDSVLPSLHRRKVGSRDRRPLWPELSKRRRIPQEKIRVLPPLRDGDLAPELVSAEPF